MIRRDSERNHPYATEVFRQLKIYDLQGLLKEGEVYKCGIEAYQVPDFSLIDFTILKQEDEVARLKYCEQLAVPYYVIITAVSTGTYQLYKAILRNALVSFELCHSFSKVEFITWWRHQQSFTQKKPMYDAASRISKSIIDQDLFGNALAWGVNIDGFTISEDTGQVLSIIEKRVCTFHPPYTLVNYDPNKYFHGTPNRAGDYPSWQILFDLSKRMNTMLLLLTFDTSNTKCVGAAKILDISHQNGIIYQHNLKPFENLFTDDTQKLDNWMKKE